MNNVNENKKSDIKLIKHFIKDFYLLKILKILMNTMLNTIIIIILILNMNVINEAI